MNQTTNLRTSVLTLLMTVIIASLGMTPTYAQEEETLTRAEIIEGHRQAVKRACPQFWEEITAQVDITQHTAGLWIDDAAGRTEFIDYLSEMMAELAPDQAGLETLADDPLSVATECATQKTQLMERLIVDLPNDLMNTMQAVDSGYDNILNAWILGTQDKPGKSCKEIKAAISASEDGPYWIDPNEGDSSDAIEVYCDMTTDGGGWTFVAYIKQAIPDNLWSAPTNPELYRLDRATIDSAYSLGLLGQMDDTEMMLTLNTPDPATAVSNAKFIQFRYAASNPHFSTGPIPCTPANIDYRTTLEGDYSVANLSSCGAVAYYLNAATASYPLLLHVTLGAYSYSALGSAAGWYHRVWFYVR